MQSIGSCSNERSAYSDWANLYRYYAVLSGIDPSGTLTDDEPRTVPRKLQCSLNCCCCPVGIELEKGTKVLDSSVAFFKAIYPFKVRLKMVFKPVAKPFTDPLNETSDCGLEWSEFRVGEKHPYTGVADEWRDVLTFPKVTHFDMFDDWFETERPQECSDNRGRPKSMPFEVVIPDQPGIEKGQGRDKLDGYIGILLRANPNCNCRYPSFRLALHVTAGRQYATLDKLNGRPPFPTPPGLPPSW